MADFMKDSGVPYRITSTIRLNDAGSYHALGLATDFAGPLPWNQAKPSPQLVAIWNAWMAQAGGLTELIYSGAPFYVSKGVVRSINTLSSDLRAAHWNHVHVAVPKGWRYTKKVVVPEIAPPDIDIQSPPGFVAAGIAALCDSNGVCTGYLILGTDGGVFGFGPGSRYFGRVH